VDMLEGLRHAIEETAEWEGMMPRYMTFLAMFWCLFLCIRKYRCFGVSCSWLGKCFAIRLVHIVHEAMLPVHGSLHPWHVVCGVLLILNQF